MVYEVQQMRYTQLDKVHSALTFVLLKVSKSRRVGGRWIQHSLGDHARDLSLPGSCTVMDQEELLGVWNGLNCKARQCSGAILRT
jgi:hypothetical protein